MTYLLERFFYTVKPIIAMLLPAGILMGGALLLGSAIYLGTKYGVVGVLALLTPFLLIPIFFIIRWLRSRWNEYPRVRPLNPWKLFDA